MEDDPMKRIPAVDTSCCNLCGGCLELCPQVFRLNQNGGYVEVLDLDDYPEEEVDDAINNCPQDCITWEE